MEVDIISIYIAEGTEARHYGRYGWMRCVQKLRTDKDALIIGPANGYFFLRVYQDLKSWIINQRSTFQ